MKRIITLAVVLAVLLCASPAALALTDEEWNEGLRAAVQEAMDACVDGDMTDVEVLTALHDWMCLNCDYGITSRRYTAYGALVDGAAVCMGYANGYAYLTAAAGLEGTATYSDSQDHAWILVTLDGKRYFSDTTWDDGKFANLGLIRHDYFLFGAANAFVLNHYGWDSDEEVTGGEMEYAPWMAAQTRVIFQEGWCWYIDKDFNLWRCDRDTWETELLLTVDQFWPNLDEGEGFYDGVYTGLIYMDGRLWFNTPYEICSVSTDGTDLETELTPDTSESVIYGLGVEDGFLCYSLTTTPDDMFFYDIVGTSIAAGDAWGY